MVKAEYTDGFMGRSSFNNNNTQCKIIVTDRQLIICPNIFSLDAKVINRNYIHIMHGHIEKLELKDLKK